MRVTGLSWKAALLSLTLGLHAAPPVFEIQVKKPDDKVTLDAQGDRAVFTVFTKSGIGDFSASLKSGEWPREVSVILNRTRIERFGLETDRLVATGYAKSPEDHTCSFQFRSAKGEVEHEYNAGTLRIKVSPIKDGLEIAFPRDVVSKQMSFGWIDVYRR